MNNTTQNIEIYDNCVHINHPCDFDLLQTFECGQCFRFNKISENTYRGIAFGKVLTLEKYPDKIILYVSENDFLNIWRDFLDLDTDYAAIKKELSKNDPVMGNAIKSGEGIRILKQDTWETIVSFIISASNNIPRIKAIIERLCENFGERIEYGESICYSFPTAEKLASLSLDELSVIRAGFRDKYIKAAAEAVVGGDLPIAGLRTMNAADAKKALMSIKGIGNKVSDCVLLFGLGHTESFPIDVWIKRIMENFYFSGSKQTIKTISALAECRFGSLGGYAQQYLFYYARENGVKEMPIN